MIKRECTHWKRTTEKGRHYDTMISMNIKYSIDKVLWLPFKSLEEETNSAVFRAAMAGYSHLQDIHTLQIIELIVQNEGKVMETTNVSILNETESASAKDESSMIKKFDLRTHKLLNLPSKATNISLMPENSHFISLRLENEPDILLYDIKNADNTVDALSEDKPILRITGHEQSGYGFDWNLHHESRLLSVSPDSMYFWDLKTVTEGDLSHEPDWIWKGQYNEMTGDFYDVKWLKNDPNNFCFTSQNGILGL